jgi:hypothetical protein
VSQDKEELPVSQTKPLSDRVYQLIGPFVMPAVRKKKMFFLNLFSSVPLDKTFMYMKDAENSC